MAISFPLLLFFPHFFLLSFLFIIFSQFSTVLVYVRLYCCAVSYFPAGAPKPYGPLLLQRAVTAALVWVGTQGFPASLCPMWHQWAGGLAALSCGRPRPCFHGNAPVVFQSVSMRWHCHVTSLGRSPWRRFLIFPHTLEPVCGRGGAACRPPGEMWGSG